MADPQCRGIGSVGATEQIMRLAAAAAMLSALWLGACTPLAVASLAQSLIGGGPERSTAFSSPVGGTAPTVQNSRPLDESVMQALAASDATVLAMCRQMLPDLPPIPEGRCEIRAVCLPGARVPAEARLCAMPQPQDRLAAAQSTSAAPSASAGWDWENPQ